MKNVVFILLGIAIGLTNNTFANDSLLECGLTYRCNV